MVESGRVSEIAYLCPMGNLGSLRRSNNLALITLILYKVTIVLTSFAKGFGAEVRIQTLGFKCVFEIKDARATF